MVFCARPSFRSFGGVKARARDTLGFCLLAQRTWDKELPRGALGPEQRKEHTNPGAKEITALGAALRHHQRQ